MRRTVVAILLVLAPAFALAGNWEYRGLGDGGGGGIDLDSIGGSPSPLSPIVNDGAGGLEWGDPLIQDLGDPNLAGPLPVGHLPRRTGYYDVFDEFVGGTTSNLNIGLLRWTLSGTSATVAIPSASSMDGRFGIRCVTPSTGTTDGASINLSQDAAPLLAGWRTDFIVKMPSALSDGTDTYNVMIGYSNGWSSATPNYAAQFVYDHDGIGTAWQFYSRDNGTAQTTTTTVTVAAATWVSLGIEVNAAGTEMKAYIDGTERATHSTIPTSSSASGYWTVGIQKSAGSTQPAVCVDFVGMRRSTR